MTILKRFPRPLALALCGAVIGLLLLPASAFALTSTGDGGWQWLDPQPQGNDLEAVVALDAQHAVAGGDYGTLLATSDGGATWSFHVPGIIGVHVAALSSAGSGGLWAVVWAQNTDLRALAHSSDGGTTWTTKKLAGPVWAVDFADARHGWALGDDTALREGGVWATSDGGRTWKFHAVARSRDFSSIDFVDASHGWAAGSTSVPDDPMAGSTGAIFATSDGGVSWHKQYKQSFTGDSEQMNTVSFVNADDGWAVGNGSDMGGAGTIVATTDGGAHWTAQSAGSDWDLSGITFVDAEHGWLPEGGSTYFTTDGGADWAAADTGLTSVNAVSFANALDGYAVGGAGGMATTTDGGQTWQARSAGTPVSGLPILSALAFPDAAHGWAVGGNQILSTSDGGATWSALSVGSSPQGPLFEPSLDALSFPDTSQGWAVGDTKYGYTPAVWHTSDAGQSWQLQYTGSGRAPAYTGVDFVDDVHGWVSGASGGHAIVGATTDGGATWSFVSPPRAPGRAAALSFVDATHGWLASYAYTLATPAGGFVWKSTILRTTDGGRTCKRQDVTRRQIILRDIAFVDRLHGWAVGQNGGSKGACVVLTTGDGGRTWGMQRLSAPYGGAGRQVVFSDRLHGWIACGPIVYATVDGGRHWRAQRPGSLVDAIAFADSDHGWAAVESGDWTFGSGGILTTTTGGFRPGQ